MATEWVKSLQCKSRALDDVVLHHHHHHHHHTNTKHPLIPASSSCRNSAQSLKDVIETTKQKPRKKPKQPQPQPPPPQPPRPPPPRPPNSMKTDSGSNSTNRIRPSTSMRHLRVTDPCFPALTDLPEGHPSRKVVEIIFHTGWSPKAFSGLIEMIFKVQNTPRTVTRFEEYRETVKSRAASGGGAALDDGCKDHARCVADGNEMMRFHCLGPTAGGPGYDCGGAWAFHGGKGATCTFSGSGGAHESAGGGSGRRAMLVCRVIAGRVCNQLGFDSLLKDRVGFNSVSGDNGELLVFDSRAILPCFLIIYKF